jgi:hypothetical protein
VENRKTLIDEDGEVREITAEDIALFKPFSTLPEAERRMLPGLRRKSQVSESRNGAPDSP